MTCKPFKIKYSQKLDTQSTIYITHENSPLTNNTENNKNPIELLISIFKPATTDKYILVISFILAIIHLSIYNLNIPVILELIRILLMLALILYLTRASCAAYQNNTLIINSFKSNPLQFFTFIIACGGMLALVVPSTMNIFKLIGDSAPLTTAMLGITGGIIAVFGIIKTHQKNLLDEENLRLEREKYAKSIKEQKSTNRREKKRFKKSMEQQKYQFEKNLKQQIIALKEQKKQFKNSLKIQADKNTKDYIRQVHEDRRSRYARAIDQLAGEKATVRLGGVYTLVSLVDEWLNDTSIKKNKRKKEGQAIINNLCSYMRSPFELAESYYIFDKKNLTEYDLEEYGSDKIFKDKSEFHGEKHVRQAILHEIKSRLSSGNAKDKEGAWSNFTYDFSNSHIFYTFDLSNGFLSADSKFSNINFLCDAKFNSTTFKNIANFSNTVFHGSAEFSNTIFEDIARFRKAEFKESDTFKNIADFSNTVFHESAEFSNTIFEDIAYFWKAEFKESATFERVQFKSGQGIQDSNMQSSDSRYLQFKSSADFRQAIFGKIAEFGMAKFYGSADFRETWFQTISPLFHTSDGPKIYAKFSQNADPQNYIFNKLHNESRPIKTETKTYETKLKMPTGESLSNEDHFNIPKGCHLFKP